jgi:hypothetical protein
VQRYTACTTLSVQQLPSGFHIGPLVVVAGGDAALTAAEAKRKVKGKRIRKKRPKGGDDATAAAAGELDTGGGSDSRLERQGSFGSFSIPPEEEELVLQTTSALATTIMALGLGSSSGKLCAIASIAQTTLSNQYAGVELLCDVCIVLCGVSQADSTWYHSGAPGTAARCSTASCSYSPAAV